MKKFVPGIRCFIFKQFQSMSFNIVALDIFRLPSSTNRHKLDEEEV